MVPASRILRRSLASGGRRMYLHRVSRLCWSLAATLVCVQVEAMVLGAQFAFGNGAVVGVEHDADNLAFVGWTGWRCAAGSSREQSGQERILLAHRFVGNDGDLAVARRGDERDDTATLEKAENALARTTHEGLDLVLRGRRRWVEHLTLSVAVCGVHTVQENGV